MANEKNESNIIIYNTIDGKASVVLYAHDGSVWMKNAINRSLWNKNQNQLAELFDTSKQGIGQHIANILNDGELDANSVVKKFFTTASDGKNYDKTDKATQMFFAETQNRLLYAVIGQTAAEIIVGRADASKPNMALTSWQGSIVRKGDIYTAKNYLQCREHQQPEQEEKS